MIEEYFAYVFDFQENINNIIESNYALFLKHIDYLCNVRELGKLLVTGLIHNKTKEITLLCVHDEKLAEAIFLNDPLRKSKMLQANFYSVKISLLSKKDLFHRVTFCKREEVMKNYEKEETDLFLGFSKKSKTSKTIKIPELELKIIETHYEYIKSKFKSSIFLVVGVILDENPINFTLTQAENMTEANLLFKNDPAIAQNIFEVEICQFNVLLTG